MSDVYRKVSLRLLPLLVVIYLFAYIDRTVVGFAQLDMGADLGIGAAAFGLGAGLFFLAYAFLEVPSNLLLMRYGPRRWFARIMISWGLVTMAMAFAQGPISFYILRFLLGVAEAGFYPGILYLITRWFPGPRRGRIVGLFLLANPIALALGSPLSGSLLSLDGVGGLAGWQWLFLVVGLPPVLLAFVVLRVLPDHPSDATWLTEQERAIVAADVAADSKQVEHVANHHPLAALKDRRVLLLAAGFLAYPLLGYGLSLWLPIIISAFGVSAMATGWLATLPWIAAALALIWVPRRAERKRTPFAHIAGTLVLAGIGLAAGAVFDNPVVQMIALCVAAFGIFAGQPIYWSFPQRMLTGTAAAAGLAFINSVGSIGGFVGPYGVGLVIDGFGTESAGLMFLALWAIYGLVMLVFVRRMVQRNPIAGGPVDATAPPSTITPTSGRDPA
ncbi:MULTISPECIES: MFS transporter [Pseudonocardia]|uniref:MFS transporter n=2 Tax=Pseudonocardia TaxID=1847 RepID=A0ABQ0S8Q0_9PSEU|nr:MULTISPECIES: MFS transporter [Pseudonocardia]OSY34819.1 putative tartrate transporter [Pseudonocardia autotrophica]TDN73024.1 sugar phosphate permease [Pseudonocardia autotrophica]BBG03743.1 MFS transporter [Pseudonocardia autotrophica]GEC29282.1 MFS transporter [Pseudonocardia saturnea]